MPTMVLSEALGLSLFRVIREGLGKACLYTVFPVKSIGPDSSRLYRFGARTPATSSNLLEQFTRLLTGLGPRTHLIALDS